MVIRAHLTDWRARLDELQRLIADDPHGPTWLWKLQAKILSYLVARYGKPPAPTRGTPTPGTAVEAGSAPPDLAASRSRRPLPAEPAVLGEDARQRIRSIARDLHEINSARRAARGVEHAADRAWEWWRQRYAR